MSMKNKDYLKKVIHYRSTSGNTGISLAMMCAERGYKCIIVNAIRYVRERKKMMKFFGAHLIEVGAGDFDGSY